MKNKFRFSIVFSALLLVGIIVGCSTSFNSGVFNSEQIAADSAIGATHTFNLYYAAQTNPPASLVSAKQSIDEADENLSKSLAIVESLRQAYATNSAATNSAAISVALQAVQLQATNIVSLVQSIITATK